MPTITALDQLMGIFATKTFEQLAELGASEQTPMSLACFDDGSPLHLCGRTDMMVACYPGAPETRVGWIATYKDGGCCSIPHAADALPLARGGELLLRVHRFDSRRPLDCAGERASYGKHIDSVDGDGREPRDRGRVWTMVYYLNDEAWDADADGGCLRLFPPPPPASTAAGGDEATAAAARPNVAHDIVPTANTFVIFRADRVVHEVCPAHKARMAASIWFYGGTKEQARAAVERGEISAAS